MTDPIEPEPMDVENEPSEACERQRRQAEKRKGKKIAVPIDKSMDEEEMPEEEAGDFGGDEQGGEPS